MEKWAVRTQRQREPGRVKPAEDISAQADDWIRQFIRHLESNCIDMSRHLSGNAKDAACQSRELFEELQRATVRAVVATIVDSGIDLETALEELAHAALKQRSPLSGWNDAMNARRFVLIDKEIQGTISLDESVELAGLTRIMREHVESERNLPLEGARALHEKLLKLESPGEPD